MMRYSEIFGSVEVEIIVKKGDDTATVKRTEDFRKTMTAKQIGEYIERCIEEYEEG